VALVDDLHIWLNVYVSEIGIFLFSLFLSIWGAKIMC
jgi:hypothetical protein